MLNPAEACPETKRALLLAIVIPLPLSVGVLQVYNLVGQEVRHREHCVENVAVLADALQVRVRELRHERQMSMQVLDIGTGSEVEE